MESANRLFDQAAVCGARYAIIAANLFDPVMASNDVEPDVRKALRYYAYAAAQGEAAEVLQRLEELRAHRSVKSDRALQIEIDRLGAYASRAPRR
ncbi:MAG: hypothetical protein HC897_12380 [Thermoanaerobaculia bacterium]|nr:hypothetical protein [Thermoanaerobaculia bacterium]